MESNTQAIALMFGGLAALIGYGVWLLRRGELRQPLAAIPVRETTLGMEHIVALFLTYFLLGQAVAAMTQSPPPDPSGFPADLKQTTDLSPAPLDQATALARNDFSQWPVRLIGIVLILWFARKGFDTGIKGFGINLKRPFEQIWLGVLGFLGASPLIHGSMMLVQWTVAALELELPIPQHQVIGALAQPLLAPFWKSTLIVSVMIVVPISEELFFRGMIQSVLLRLGARRAMAILLAGGVFGLAHFEQKQAVIPLALFGIVLGYLYERSRSLFVPILTHALFNGITLARVLTYQAHGIG
jgi:membrane protease YdiL (CAAX protease family)